DGNLVVQFDTPRSFLSTYGAVALTAGTHTFEWMGYEQASSAGFEVSVAAGTNTSAVSAANGWRVLGDNTLPGNGLELQGSIALTVTYAASKQVVAGNYIGTNAAGTAALVDTLDGVQITSSRGNVIGVNGDGSAGE